jgi:hypothetical protein
MVYKLVRKLSTGQLADYTEEIRGRKPDSIEDMGDLPMPEYAVIVICAARDAGWFDDTGPPDDDVRGMDYLNVAEPLALDILKLYQKYSMKRLTKEEKKSSKERRQSAP